MARASAIPLLLLVLAARPAAAETYVGLQSPPVAGSARDAAAAFLQAEARTFDLASVDLVYRQTLARGPQRTVRLAQVHDGLPVLGGAAAVRVAPDGRVLALGLHVARDLRVGTTPRVDRDEARALLAAEVAPRLAAARLGFTLAVLPDDAGGRLVWRIDVPDGRGGWRYLVDAQRAELLDARPLAVHALGRVYSVSSVNTPTPADVELLDLDVSSPQVLTGWSGNLIVTNYVSGGTMSSYTLAQSLNPNSGDDFLYDPPADRHDATDGFAQVGLYYHLTRMREFYATELGVDFTPADWKLVAVANAMEDGDPLDNAFFTEMDVGAPWNAANLIAVGQGTDFDFADDSDVFLHEFTHYVSFKAINYNMSSFASNEYGRSPFSAAIDEGLADYFACTVNGDATLGEASLAPFGQERDLTKATKVCPDDMNGEPHDDGEIIGSLSWTLRTAFGKDVADQLVWGAMSLLVPYATFGDYGQALLQTADELVTAGQLTAADVQTLQDALDARGVAGCFAELTLTGDQPQHAFSRGLDYLAALMGGTCQSIRDRGRQRQSLFHFAATPAAGDVGVRLKVALDPRSSGSDLKWQIYGRRGQHVGFSSGGMSTSVSDYDWVSAEFTGANGELVIDAASDPPFDPAQSNHFVILHQNCPDTMATVTVEPLAPPQEDAGVDATAADAPGADAGEDGGGKGCGCRSAGDAGPLGGALLILLGLVLARRRRG